MAQNVYSLKQSKANKNDEFYTQLSDIENEVKNYWPQLEGKKIWCNCDDPQWSKFNHFFEAQRWFHDFEVRFSYYQPEFKGEGYTAKKLDKPLIKKNSKGKIITLNKVYVDEQGFCKGDFRAEEQKPLWEWADVIITNPPFTLFREFVDMVMEKEKKFLIIGGQNAISYKEVFKYIKTNKMWLGVSPHLLELKKVNEQGEIETITGKTSNLPNTCVWFTNMNHEKRNRSLILTDWDDEKFVKYENYDAYETVWTYGEKKRGRAEIPFTDKVLGVPITFLHKFCPTQFEILGLSPSDFAPTKYIKTKQLKGQTKGSITTNCKGCAFIKANKENANFQGVETNEYYDVPFARIFIRLKKEWYEEYKDTYLG